MTELQTDEVVIDDEKPEIAAEAETQEGSELAPEKPEKVEFDEKQQEVFNNAIGKKTHQLRSTERELEETKQKLQEIEQKLPTATAPEIPKLPDRYDFDSDEEYYKAVSDRDDALRQKVEFESQQKLINEHNALIEQNALVESQRKEQEAETALIQRADKNGIKQQDLLAAANTVGQYRLNADIANQLVNDEDGDVMIMYLAENPMELDSIARMGTFDAARQIDTAVREKAQKFKPKSSDAPDPTTSTTIRGKGASEDKDGFTLE